MTWRSDLGREDAVCHVARPLAPLPVEPPEAETPKVQPDPKKGPDPKKSDERGATGDR
jgi:hypothetical protein